MGGAGSWQSKNRPPLDGAIMGCLQSPLSPGPWAAAVIAESVSQKPEATNPDPPLRSYRAKSRELLITVIPLVCSLCWTFMNTSHSSLTLTFEVSILLSPLYRWGNRGSAKWNDMLRARMGTQVCLPTTLKPHKRRDDQVHLCSLPGA